MIRFVKIQFFIFVVLHFLFANVWAMNGASSSDDRPSESITLEKFKKLPQDEKNNLIIRMLIGLADQTEGQGNQINSLIDHINKTEDDPTKQERDRLSKILVNEESTRELMRLRKYVEEMNQSTLAQIEEDQRKSNLQKELEKNKVIREKYPRIDQYVGKVDQKICVAIDVVKNPEKYKDKRGNIPLFFTGVPGSGKTILASMMARELDVPFLSCNATEFNNKYAGETEQKWRNFFRQAKEFAIADAERKNALLPPGAHPYQSWAVIFIDEIDSIGGSREKTDHTNEIRVSTLNTLLSLMDGLETKQDSVRFIVIAATNSNPTLLDAALVRRLGKPIVFALPTYEARIQYFQQRAAKYSIDLGQNDVEVNAAIENLTFISNELSFASLDMIFSELEDKMCYEGRSDILKEDLIDAIREQIKVMRDQKIEKVRIAVRARLLPGA